MTIADSSPEAVAHRGGTHPYRIDRVRMRTLDVSMSTAPNQTLGRGAVRRCHSHRRLSDVQGGLSPEPGLWAARAGPGGTCHHRQPGATQCHDTVLAHDDGFRAATRRLPPEWPEFLVLAAT